jgi:hypothetical protein
MRAWLRRSALGLVAVTTFGSATVFGALWHLDLPLATRAARDGTALALGGLPGKSSVRIGRLSRSFEGIVVHDADADFADPEGRPALTARSATARIDPIEVLRAKIAKGTWTLALHDVRVGSVDVALDDDEKTLPRVARAFVAEPKAAPEPKPPAEPSSFVLSIDDATLDHVFAHGSLAGTWFDADANAVRGRIAIADDVLVRIDDGELVGRGLPREARARVRGRVNVPGDERPVELSADVDGRFGDAFVHARALGDLARLDATATGTTRGGALAAVGSFWLPTDTAPGRARAWARTNEVPLRALDPSAPDGSVTAEAIASATLGDAIAAVAKVRTQPTTIAGQRIPTVEARANGQGRTWNVDATATDPGLWAHVVGKLDGALVHADLQARADDLGALTVLPSLPVHGATTATATLDGDLDATRFVANATADVQRLRAGPAHAARARVRATAELAGDWVTASGSATLAEGGARVDAAVRSVRFSTTSGLASAAAELRTKTGRAKVELDRRRIDGALDALALGDLTPFVDVDLPITAATVTGTFAMGRGARPELEVHARADDVDGTLADRSFAGGQVVVDGLLSGRDLSLTARATLVDEATVAIRADRMQVPVLAFDRASLLRVLGQADVDADVTFACLRAWFGDDVPSSKGRVVARVRYEHAREGDAHLVGFDVATEGAALTAPALGSLEGIDARVGGLVSLDDTRADVVVEARDRLGAIVTARLGTGLDVPVWSAALTDLERWKRAPLGARIEIPEREVKTLPSALRPANVGGRIAVVVDAHGTALDPAATFTFDDRGATSGNAGEPPIDLHVGGKVDRTGASATIATAPPSDGAKTWSKLDGRVRVDLPWSEVLAGRAADAWVASATVQTESLALGAIAGWFTRTPIQGTTSGFVNVEGLHRDARAGIALELRGVAVGRRPVGSGRFAALLDGQRAAVELVLVQQGGRIDVAAGGSARWGKDLVPMVDLVRGIDGSLRASSFDLSFARPFVRSALPGFAGRLDAGLGFHVTNDLHTSTVLGTATLSGGRAEVAAIGDELRDVRIKLDFAAGGAVKISDVEVYPATGRLNASGEAKLEGLDPRQLTLRLRVPKGYEIPVGMEGMPVGDLEGDIDLKLDRAKDGALTLAVNVPKTRLTLTPLLGRDVQTLDQDPHVHLGKRGDDGAFTEIHAPKPTPVEPSPIPLHVDLTLGDEVWIERQSDVEARITGKLGIDLSPTLRLTGAVSSPEGWAEIQGRRFRIERARVSFDGQPPSDPVIQATARYDAAGGIKIFADWVGTIQKGRLSLRAEPNLTPNEIVSTLVFGSPNAQVGSSRGASTSPALQAAAFAGGYVTQGLNKALDDVSPLAVTTRVDTSSSANPRPEVSVRLLDDVSLTIGVNLGIPSPGQPPDRTTFQLEYQFLPQWKLRTTGGDKGTAILDFIWQYRY